MKLNLVIYAIINLVTKTVWGLEMLFSFNTLIPLFHCLEVKSYNIISMIKFTDRLSCSLGTFLAISSHQTDTQLHFSPTLLLQSLVWCAFAEQCDFPTFLFITQWFDPSVGNEISSCIFTYITPWLLCLVIFPSFSHLPVLEALLDFQPYQQLGNSNAIYILALLHHTISNSAVPRN